MKITEKITITQEDNLILMSRYPDKYFELGIIDPPYGINAPRMSMGSNPKRKGDKQYGGVSTAVKLKGRLNTGSGKLKNRKLNKSNIDWDNEIPTPEYFAELFRVCKNVIIWGGNYFDLPPTRGIVFWDKLQPWENFSQFELAWTTFDVPAFKIAISTTGGANKETKIHPTQKPVELYKTLLKKFAKTGDKILDTHVGSASIGIACHDFGFELIACDKSPVHYKDAVNRLKNYVANHQSLFSAEELLQQPTLF